MISISQYEKTEKMSEQIRLWMEAKDQLASFPNKGLKVIG